jgi:Cu/Ag efflux pump CusA
LSSTVLTLLLLPVLYEWAHRAGLRGARKNIL